VLPHAPQNLIPPVPLYVAAALAELGVVEDARPFKSAARIEEYHAATVAGRALDDVPWCSSFLCFCFERAGILSTRSKAASSWLRWGTSCLPKPFAVCCFPKSDPDAGGTGHVALSLGLSGSTVYVIGGNQSNRVSIMPRLARDVISWRAPDEHFPNPGALT